MVEKSPHPPTNRHTINKILKIPIAARNLQPRLLALPAETAFRTGTPALARVPPSVFPGGGSEVQPQALYKHRLPAASSPASAPARGHCSKPGCSQPETRALLPQDALASTLPGSVLCTQHFPGSHQALVHRAQPGRLCHQHTPSTGGGRSSRGCFAAMPKRDWKGALPLVSLAWLSDWV